MKILIHEDMMDVIGDDLDVILGILESQGFDIYTPITIMELKGVGTFFEQYEFCYN